MEDNFNINRCYAFNDSKYDDSNENILKWKIRAKFKIIKLNIIIKLVNNKYKNFTILFDWINDIKSI
jgi:hypothetical protein